LIRISNGKKIADHSKTGLFVWFSNNEKQNGGQSNLKPDLKAVRKMTIRIPDSPVFRGSLYFVIPA
jgi:hypothetical protein